MRYVSSTPSILYILLVAAFMLHFCCRMLFCCVSICLVESSLITPLCNALLGATTTALLGGQWQWKSPVLGVEQLHTCKRELLIVPKMPAALNTRQLTHCTAAGFMLPDPDNAVIWRGPRKNGLIKQFLKDVDWG